MTIIFFTLIISLVLAGVFLGVFIWAAKTGQYDDLTTPGHRVLIEDCKKKKNNLTEDTHERSN